MNQQLKDKILKLNEFLFDNNLELVSAICYDGISTILIGDANSKDYQGYIELDNIPTPDIEFILEDL